MCLWLIARRKELGYSQRYVADKCGITQQAYSLYETGARHPSRKTAKKIGNVLGVSWIRFYEDDEENVS